VPTKRRKIVPRRVNGPVPEWAARLLATGERPEWNTEDHDAFAGWFLGDEVPGLPDAHSPAGCKLREDGRAY
jgi:hypothetical protein